MLVLDFSFLLLLGAIFLFFIFYFYFFEVGFDSLMCFNQWFVPRA